MSRRVLGIDRHSAPGEGVGRRVVAALERHPGEADNAGSGLPRSAGGLDELRTRVAAELEAGPILDRSSLAIDGDDLMAGLGLVPGPGLGRVLDGLLERVIDDPRLNEAPTLLLLARQLVVDDR